MTTAIVDAVCGRLLVNVPPLNAPDAKLPNVIVYEKGVLGPALGRPLTKGAEVLIASE